MDDPAVVRSEFLDLDPSGFTVGERTELELFDGVTVPVIFARRERAPGSLGSEIWTGAIDGDPRSGVTFAVREDAISGQIRTAGGQYFEIGIGADGLLIVREMDPSQIPPCPVGVVPPEGTGGE